MKIKCGRSSCKIAVLPANEYPSIPDFEEKNSFSLDAELFAGMIRQTLFAVSTSDIKPVLTGECFTVKDKTLEIAAIDGFRLAVRTEPVGTDHEGRFIVCAKQLQASLKLIKSAEEVKIVHCRRHAVFDFGNIKIFGRLIEGDFHNYEATLKINAKTEAVISVRPVTEALERFMLLVSDKVKAPLRCEFSDGSIGMSLKSAIGEMDETIEEVDLSGEKVCIGFNSRYLLEALKASEADKVKLQLSGGLSPMKIVPADGGSDFSFLVLPVRLKN